MIEIRDGRIYFYHAHKPEVQARDFQCLSAYVCPHCQNVLAAYFVGYISDLKEFSENDDMKYAYEMGHSNGGTWIYLQVHKHKDHCKWQYPYAARGISNGVEFFLKQYPKSTMVNKQSLIEALETNMAELMGITGFHVVKDEIGIDAPILMFNEIEIVGKDTFFEEKRKRIEKMGEYLDSKFSL